MFSVSRPKFRIDRSTSTNLRMFANLDIARGERIMAERPLVTLDVGLTSLYKPETFFDRDPQNKIANGVVALHKKFDRADDETQRRILDLHHGEPANSSREHLYMAIIRKNAFDDVMTKDGQEYCVLHLYNNLCRINHSCRPNATIVWNSHLGQGTLHALEDISSDREILVEYLANVSDCLKHKVPRQKALRTHYNFYPCGCPACSTSGSEDGYARVSAKNQYDIVEGHDMPNESSQTGRTRRSTACDSYIEILRTLEIRDNKLADAYNRLAQLHSEDFLAASRIANHQHCGDCRTDQTARGHMDKVLKAHDEAYLIHLCCFGSDHPVILHDEQRRRQWAAQLLSVPPRAITT